MIRNLFSNQLANRMVVYSLLIGSVLSVFSTGVQLLLSYQHQKDDALQVVDQVDAALTQSLEFALWRLDFNQVEIILDGLETNEWLSHIDLSSDTGETWERGNRTGSGVSRVYDLVHRATGKPDLLLGTLVVEVSLESVQARVWDQFWVTFQTNLAKAYLAAIALLFVAHKLITRHLSAIAAHVATTRVDDTPLDLTLERTPRRSPDDLDEIVNAIKGFDRNARDAVTRLRGEVQERIKSEQDAREALSVRSTFIGTMSHEIRTPLNSIMGFLHLIENSDEVPEKQRHYAHVATKASQQLHNQLTNVLEVSRLDSNAVSIVTRPTDLRALGKQWRDTTEASVHFHGKSIVVRLDVDGDLDDCYDLDGARLTQVVTNLTDNAAKFTPSGEIRISIRCVPMTRDGQDTHGIEIGVADTGEGIDDAQRDMVFERFTQSESGLNRAHSGSGLGLTISRDMCALMGAQLTLDPIKGDGFSTRFLITLGCNVRLERHDG